MTQILKCKRCKKAVYEILINVRGNWKSNPRFVKPLSYRYPQPRKKDVYQCPECLFKGKPRFIEQRIGKVNKIHCIRTSPFDVVELDPV